MNKMVDGQIIAMTAEEPPTEKLRNLEQGDENDLKVVIQFVKNVHQNYVSKCAMYNVAKSRF